MNYKAKEAAKQLGVSIRTVYYWMDNGFLQFVEYPSNRGKRPMRRIPQSAIDQFQLPKEKPAPAIKQERVKVSRQRVNRKSERMLDW